VADAVQAHDPWEALMMEIRSLMESIRVGCSRTSMRPNVFRRVPLVETQFKPIILGSSDGICQGGSGWSQLWLTAAAVIWSPGRSW
jgi:hypothetical protein